MTCRNCLNRSERADSADHAQLSRRDFLANAGGLAAMAAVAACGDGTITGGNPPRPDAQRVITVGDFPQLATVGVLVVVAQDIAVKRTGTDTFDAIYMICTHAGCATALTTQQSFACPCHGSLFDAGGAVTRGPARRPLTQLATTYDAVTDELTIN